MEGYEECTALLYMWSDPRTVIWALTGRRGAETPPWHKKKMKHGTNRSVRISIQYVNAAVDVHRVAPESKEKSTGP